MIDFRIPLGEWIEGGIDWLTDVFAWFFAGLRSMFLGMYEGTEFALQTPPFWVIIIVFAALALWIKGIRLAVGTIIGLIVVVGVGLWEETMITIALTLVSALVALIIAIPLGIFASGSETASRIVRPLLDFLQTMPAFVYLIPAIVLFRVGVVPGIVATIFFALAPGVRLTELGIRGVDKEIVEAGYAFGSTKWRILRRIQLPLALPSIMAGVNQVIMLSLSMVVIAGMVGAGGLGGVVVQAVQRIRIGLGFEAGIAVVIIAIILDRLTGALGERAAKPRSNKKRATDKSNAKQTV